LIREVARKTGVDKLTLKTVNGQYIPDSYGQKKEDVFPRKKSLRRNVARNSSCSRVYFSSVVNWDGDVVPCCYDANAQYAFGRLDYQQGEGFQGIWNNSRYRDFRHQLLTRKKDIDMCRGCHGTFESLNVQKY